MGRPTWLSPSRAGSRKRARVTMPPPFPFLDTSHRQSPAGAEPASTSRIPCDTTTSARRRPRVSRDSSACMVMRRPSRVTSGRSPPVASPRNPAPSRCFTVEVPPGCTQSASQRVVDSSSNRRPRSFSIGALTNRTRPAPSTTRAGRLPSRCETMGSQSIAMRCQAALAKWGRRARAAHRIQLRRAQPRH
jgi:hypothetical protein